MHFQKRIIEVDLLRTIAMAMMIFYHIAFDLYYIYDWSFNPLDGAWWWFARSCAVLFLLLVGISAALSFLRRPSVFYLRSLRRGFGIFLLGLLVTAVSTLFFPLTTIHFGVLHCIGISIILLPVFAMFRWATLPAVCLFFVGSLFVGPTQSASILLLPIGVSPIYYQTLDYFPLIPWFGFVLLGFMVGYKFYKHRSSGFLLSTYLLRILSLPGRYALSIYLLHQPVILVVLWFLLA